MQSNLPLQQNRVEINVYKCDQLVHDSQVDTIYKDLKNDAGPTRYHLNNNEFRHRFLYPTIKLLQRLLQI